jgi:tRNA-modifying protein YgfZ
MKPPLFPMSSLRSLAVSGEDARRFLQNQLSSDLDQVTTTRGQLSAWHDPKGRVLAILRILPQPEGFLLLLNAGLLPTVAQRMQMFVLRAKVQLSPGPQVFALPDSGHEATGVVAGLVLETEPLSAGCTATVSALRMPGRTGWLLAGELESAASPDAAAEAAWDRAEVEAGLPEVYPETTGQFVSQMLNLDRIGAVSFTKGCYPGQEIVARAHHLGRVKRRIRLFRTTGAPPAPGTSLAESRGTVVRAAAGDGACPVLAVVPEDSDGPFALEDGRVLTAA